MVKVKPSRPFLTLWLLGMVAILLVAGCAQAVAPTTTPIITFKVSMLVQLGEGDLRWTRDVEVSKGTNAYELTEQVTQGDLKATWYPAFRSHFMEAILGVENRASNFWLIFLWNEPEQKWEPLPVGADLFSLKDGHVLAWAYTDTSQKPSPLPVATP